MKSNEGVTMIKFIEAVTQVYGALQPLPVQVRDRVLKVVQEQLNSERIPGRLDRDPGIAPDRFCNTCQKTITGLSYHLVDGSVRCHECHVIAEKRA